MCRKQASIGASFSASEATPDLVMGIPDSVEDFLHANYDLIWKRKGSVLAKASKTERGQKK